MTLIGNAAGTQGGFGSGVTVGASRGGGGVGDGGEKKGDLKLGICSETSSSRNAWRGALGLIWGILLEGEGGGEGDCVTDAGGGSGH